MNEIGELTFSITDVFDPDDEVARWLTVLAMASNDFWRLFRWMDDAVDDPTRILAYRLATAALHEAASHLTETPRSWPRIEAFLSALPEDARADKDRVCGAGDPKSEHYVGKWIERHRNVTFHYAIVHQERAKSGREELKQALERASAQRIEGKITITNQSFGRVRFDFADEVAVQWLPDVDADEGVGQHVLVREALLALARFAQHAIGAHLKTFPAGVVRGLPLPE
jgi:hypothetical protein